MDHQSPIFNTSTPQHLILPSILILLLLIGCSGAKKEDSSDPLAIATAANVQFAMQELMDSFTDETGIDCNMILGSSGKLTAQIKAGAPYHVFVSADMMYPADLYEEGLAVQTPVVYAYGTLVMWSCREGITPSPAVLTSEAIQHIAIANPQTAPYGTAAVEALKYYQVYDTLAAKLVYGESIAQTNQFITSGTADIGFTAKSVILSPAMQGKGRWQDVATDAYTPIAQGVIVIKRDGAPDERAEAFFDFLMTKTARQILERYGYKLPPAP